MKKDLEYYMSLPYTIQTQCIKDPVDYYFVSTVLEIDELIAHGETADEARQALREAMRLYFEVKLERGLPIPEPDMKKYLDELPVDDEPLTEEEKEQLARADEDKEYITLEELKRELDL